MQNALPQSGLLSSELLNNNCPNFCYSHNSSVTIWTWRLDKIDIEEGGHDKDWTSILSESSKNSLASVLKVPEVKRIFLKELANVGCKPPANHLVLFCLDKALLGATNFLGNAAAGRLQELLTKMPAVKKIFDRIASLDRASNDRAVLQAKLLAKLSTSEKNPADPKIDDSTSLDVLITLHQGQQLKELGEEFNDLHIGLQDDLNNFFGSFYEPVLGWNVQSDDDPDSSAVDAIRYNSGKYKFHGRDQELDLLTRFLGDLSMHGIKHAFSWLLITGSGGEGKTRLAWEFTKSIQVNWTAGRLAFGDLEKFDPGKWRPRCPTFFVIDYPAQAPERIHRLLANFQRNAREYDFPVRVLLLEREAEGEWFRKVFPEGGDTSAIRSHCFDRKRFENGWALVPIHPSAVVEMMLQRFEQAGIEQPNPQHLLSAAFKVDPRFTDHNGKQLPAPRPLFAAAVAEVLVRGKLDGAENYDTLVESLDRESVLERLIARERDQRWEKTNAGKDGKVLAEHENLLALATMCLGLSRKTLQDGLADATRQIIPDIDRKGPRPLNMDLIKTMTGGAPTHFVGLEPDILGEFFVLEVIERLEREASDSQAIRNEAFALGGDNAAVFVLRCLRDFPDRVFNLNFLSPDKAAGPGAATLFAMLYIDLSNRLGKQQLWDRVDAAFARLQALREAYPQNEKIALAEAEAAANVLYHAGEQELWDRVDAALAQLTTLRTAFPQNEEIMLAEAKSAFNVSSDAGKQKLWDRVDAAFARLQALREAYPQNEEIALQEADTVINVSNDAGEQEHWDRVDAAFARLQALRKAYPQNEEIALAEAKSAVNVSNHAGEQKLWDRVDAAFARLQALREAYPQNEEIALQKAMAAINVSSDAGNQDLWDRVDAAFAQLTTLRAAFPQNEEIALREAMAAVNVSSRAGGQQLWDRVGAAFVRLQALREAFPQNEEIALAEAEAAANVSNHAGEQKLWDRVDAAFVRLQALREAFPQNEEIALCEAKAALNVLYHAGGQQLWDRVDATFARLQALREAYPQNEEIAPREAKAAVNVLYHAGEQELWDRVDAALAQLTTLRAAFPQNEEIMLAEAKAAVNVSYHAGEQKLWDRVDAAVARLQALREAYPQNEEIALQKAMAAINVSSDAGNQDLWDRVDAAFAQLTTLRAAFPQNEEIALQKAMAAVNVSNHTGKKELWDRVDAAFAQLTTLRAAFPQNEEIALQEGRAAINVSSDAGKQELWDRVDAAFAQLTTLRAAFPQNEEIALQEGRAAVIVVSTAGEQKLWDRVDTALIQLEAVREAFPENEETFSLFASGIVLQFFFLRSGRREVELDQCVLVAQAAKYRIESSFKDNSDFMVGVSLQVIKNAHATFIDNSKILEIVEWATDAGTDFSKVPNIKTE